MSKLYTENQARKVLTASNLVVPYNNQSNAAFLAVLVYARTLFTSAYPHKIFTVSNLAFLLIVVIRFGTQTQSDSPSVVIQLNDDKAGIRFLEVLHPHTQQ